MSLTDQSLSQPKYYEKKFQSMDQEFTGFKEMLEEIGEYILPRRGMFKNDSKPQGSDFAGRHDLILDPYATRANRTLGAGMQGGLVSPSRPWFRLGLLDDDLEKFGPVKRWLYNAERIMYKVFAKSNFYNQIHTVFEEEGGFGTAVLFQEEDFKSIVNFSVMTAGTYRLANGADGMVNTIGREIWMQAHQMIEKFGEDRVSQNVRDTYKNNPFEWFQVLHFIEPRKPKNPFHIDAGNMPWASVYLDPKNDLVLMDTGYKDAPFAAPRWNTVGMWPYGLGPGADVRGSVKMLQEMHKSVIMALHKEIKPPMAVPSKFKGVLSLIPDAVNYVDVQSNDKIGPLYQVQLNIANVLQYVQAIQDSISKDYYNDLFLMIAAADKTMTATEVAERHEEKLLLLGPTIERQEKELLNVTLDRHYTICEERGLFPDPPPELENQELKFEYISLLSQAQKLITAQSINAHMTMLERVGQIDPNAVIANTDFIEMLATHADVVGVPPKISRSSDESREFLSGLQRQQEEEKAAAQAMEAAKTVGQVTGGGGDQIQQLAQTLGI